jgi:hypothetical protein
VKSLGAWGGDFMLAVSPMSGAEVISYFESKGRPTMFNWLEIVKKKGGEIAKWKDFHKVNVNGNKELNGRVEWRSPSNIALVKYWGKSGDQIPMNSSISMTLKICLYSN